ncbi:hypothetical protein D3C84_553240 [compost metagenome]
MARRPTVLHNTRTEAIREDWYGREDKHIWPLWLDDIVSGVCRLDWYGDREQQVPLSTTKLIRVLTELEVISSDSVKEILGCGIQMARKYAKAARIAYPFICRSLDDRKIRSMHYPRGSIVSAAHGEALGYGVWYPGSATDVD